MALAEITRGGIRGRLKASAMLTIMMCTWTCLWIKHGCRWRCLAVSSCIIRRAFTLVIVYAIDASSTVLKEKPIKLR